MKIKGNAGKMAQVKKTSKAGRKLDYDSYVRQYNKTKEKMEKKGYSMSSELYSKAEWEAVYAAEKGDRLNDINSGKRKTVGNINRDLVSEQQWEYSLKQAKAQQKAIFLTTNKKVSLQEIRSGNESLNWNQIHLRRQELTKLLREQLGKEASDLDVDKLISQEFFGS